MPDQSNIINQSQAGTALQPSSPMADNATATTPAVTSASPWEEALPDEPVVQKTKVIGTLEQNKAKDDTKPFVVPTDIDEKVGKKLPAAEFIVAKKEDPRIKPTPVPAAVPAKNVTPPQQKPNLPVEDKDLEGFDWFSGPPKNVAPANPTPVSQPVKPVIANSVPVPASIPEPPKSPVPSPIASASFNPAPSAAPTNASVPAGPNPFTPMETQSPRPTMPIPNIPVSKPQSSKTVQSNSGQGKKKLMFAFLSIFVLLLGSIAFTELGILSIGIEKLYGSIGMEQLWGGLPASSEKALGRSVLVMKDQKDYKISGTISLNVDSSSKSLLTQPLISLTGSDSFGFDKQLGGVITEAVRTIASAGIEDYYVQDTENSTTANTTSDAATQSAPTVESADDSVATQTATEEQVIAPKYKTVNADVMIMNSAQGSEGSFLIKNETTESIVKVVNSKENLWVKTDGNIKFGENENTDKWLEYKFDSIKEKPVQDFFNIKASSGMSVSGTREGNEKIRGERCYKYKIESLEIGEAFSGIGIHSDLIQSISGEAWIDTKTKLIRKISLKIIPSASSTASLINIDLELFDYGSVNQITSVNVNETISTTEKFSGDVKRKDDVANILAALKKYKDDNGSYPISKDLLKLNSSDNIIEKALKPKYLDSIPKDPKDPEGWYYAYKSDGKTCSLSSKLESDSDPDGQLVGSSFLYLKYNYD